MTRIVVLPTSFTRIAKRALGKPRRDVVSWLDDIRISTYTWREDLATVADVLTKLSNSRLSVNYGKCRFDASSQGVLGMIADPTGIKPSPSELEVIVNMPESITVEGLCF